MNKIFKVKKNLLGQAVVVSELAKNRGKVVSALLFSLLTVSMTHAAPVAIQGVATSENAVAVGENSFATAVDGVANGQSAIATGNGFTREEFTVKIQDLNEKIKEQKDLTSNINGAVVQINNYTNLIEGVKLKIEEMKPLTEWITEKEVGNETIRNEIEQKNAEKLVKQTELEEVRDNAIQTWGTLGNNVYNLVPILRNLNWSKLGDGEMGRNSLAEDLKQKIESLSSDFVGKFTLDDYKSLNQGYQNSQSGIYAERDKINTELIEKYNILINFNSGFESKLKDVNPMSIQNSLNNLGFFNLNDSFSYSIHSFYNKDLTSGEGKTVYNSNLVFAEAYNNLLKNKPDEIKYISENPFISSYSHDGGYDSFIKFNLKNNDGSFQPLFRIDSSALNSKNLINRLLNNAVLNIGDANLIKNEYNSFVEKYSKVDWDDSESYYNLSSMKERYTDYLNWISQLNNYVRLNDEIEAEKNKSEPDNQIIQNKFIELNNALKKIESEFNNYNESEEYVKVSRSLNGSLDDFALKKFYNFTVNVSDKAKAFYESGKEGALETLIDMRDRLTLFNHEHIIVKSVNDEYKKQYDQVKNLENEVSNINFQINELKNNIYSFSLEEENSLEELKKLELELKLAEENKGKLEESLSENIKRLEELGKDIQDSGVKDLGLRSQAHGSNAFASGNDSIAMGTNATVTVKDGISIGRDVIVSGVQSIAIGADSEITSEKSIALGVGNTIKSNNVVAIGNDIAVEAGFDKAVVLGAESTPETANPTSSITIKGNQYNFAGTNPESTVSVGAEGKERQIVNVAAGRVSATSTDTINGSQLHAVVEAVERLEATTNINWDEINTRIQAVKVPKTSIIAGDNVNLSERATDTGDIEYTVNVRLPATQPTTPTTVQAPTKPATVVKVGNDSGNINIVKEEGSVAEQRPDVYSVFINPELKLNKINVNGNTGKISGLTDGEVREGSTEAITGNQLHQTNLKVNQGLTFSTENNSEFNKQLGERITIVGDGKSIETSVSERGDIQVSLKDEIEVKKVKVGKIEITEKGINAGGNKIDNVADGEINPNSTDVVTGRQLYQVMTNIAVDSNQFAQNFGNQINKINNRVDNLEQRMTKEDKNLRAGVAGVAAIAGLPQVRGNGKSMVSAAAGNYRGQSAVAVGYTRASDNGKVLLKLSGSANTQGDVVSSVGIGYEW